MASLQTSEVPPVHYTSAYHPIPPRLSSFKDPQLVGYKRDPVLHRTELSTRHLGISSPKRRIPGAFDSASAISEETSTPASVSKTDTSDEQLSQTESPQQSGHNPRGPDPSLRSIGSTPRPSLKPALSRDAAPQVVGLFNRKLLRISGSTSSGRSSLSRQLSLPTYVFEGASEPSRFGTVDTTDVANLSRYSFSAKSSLHELELQALRRSSKWPDYPLMGHRESLTPTPLTVARKPTLHIAIPPPSLPAYAEAATSSGSSSVSPKFIKPPKTVLRQSSTLSQTLRDLEALMQEALETAEKAQSEGRLSDAATIVQGAAAALEKSRQVSGQMSSPLQLSDPGIGLSTSPSRRPDASSDTETATDNGSQVSMGSREGTEVTAPTEITASTQSSRQPLAGQHKSESLKPVRGQDRDSADSSTTPTPPALYAQPSVESMVKDFAYWQPARVCALPPVVNRGADLSQSVSGSGNVGVEERKDSFSDPHRSPVLNTEASIESIVRDFAYWQPARVRVSKHTTSPLQGAYAGPEKERNVRDEHLDGLESALTFNIEPSKEARNFAYWKPARVRLAPSADGFRPSTPQATYTLHTTIDHRHKQTLLVPPAIPERRSPRLKQPDPIRPSDFWPDSIGHDYTRRSNWEAAHHREHYRPNHPHVEAAPTSPYYQDEPYHYERGEISNTELGMLPADGKKRYHDSPSPSPGWPSRGFSLRHPRRNHISLRDSEGFNLSKQHRRQPIARDWSTGRKRLAAAIACFNTVFIGLITGIYAGEVPKIQYVLVDQTHRVILGNVLLYCGLALTTLLFWPLPLLHGRKPYTLVSFALMLPLQFPQAISVGAYRDVELTSYRIGLFFPRILTGMAMGFANINLLPTLWDLFGASLMSEKPHGELVLMDDVRRQGGGVGLWLGIWSFCFLAALPIGFAIGAGVIAHLEPAWGFYIVVILLAFFLLVNVLGPETRRAPFRRTVGQYYDDGDETYKRRVVRGEVKLHISNDGPRWWWQECWAGVILTKRMVTQRGFFVLMCYMGWIYAQFVLVSLLLGALLSRDFRWRSQYVGLANLSLAIGAFLAIPLAKANVFSRSRTQPPRTDSMTLQRSVTWTSHLLRRCLFTHALPFAGLGYTLASPGPRVAWAVPVVMAGLIGFLSTLALAECIGLLMEAFDTSDLQPGVNSSHRLLSLTLGTRARRTNYSAFPRVCAGWFAAQSFGFVLAAASTGVAGQLSRALGAQRTTAIVAAILLGITLLLLCVLWRYKEVQVVPDVPLGSTEDVRRRAGGGGLVGGELDPYWKPVIIGNPSGKMRRMNMLELGSLSRWTEIQKLNNLIRM